MVGTQLLLTPEMREAGAVKRGLQIMLRSGNST
jgi:hypothetical protein